MVRRGGSNAVHPLPDRGIPGAREDSDIEALYITRRLLESAGR